MVARIPAQLRPRARILSSPTSSRCRGRRCRGRRWRRRGLAEVGLAGEAGPAARGGRRSTLVDLSEDIRFVGISIGRPACRWA